MYYSHEEKGNSGEGRRGGEGEGERERDAPMVARRVIWVVVVNDGR